MHLINYVKSINQLWIHGNTHEVLYIYRHKSKHCEQSYLTVPYLIDLNTLGTLRAMSCN